MDGWIRTLVHKLEFGEKQTAEPGRVLSSPVEPAPLLDGCLLSSQLQNMFTK